MLEDEEAELPQVHGRQSGFQRPDEVLVEPLCFLDVETYPRNSGQIFFG